MFSKRSVFKWSIVINVALIHFFLLFISIAFSLSATMNRFDNGGDVTTLEKFVDVLTEILQIPLVILVMKFHIPIPGFLSWPLYLGNSLLWGLGFYWVIKKFVKK
jgi:hypothetical protein